MGPSFMLSRSTTLTSSSTNTSSSHLKPRRELKSKSDHALDREAAEEVVSTLELLE